MGRSRMGRGLLLAAALCASPIALADTLSLVNTVNLPAQFSSSDCNFHPQGLGVDEGASELLFAQQCSHPIYRTDLDGNLLGSVAVDRSYITSVAADATYYYFADYTGNSSTNDLYRMPKSGPPSATISSAIAAYGGYPIDVRGGVLYRANDSTQYDWSDLNQVRFANVATPDTITNTISLSGLNGMGDFAVDLDGGNLWVLEWSGGRILRYDLQNGGAPLDSFSLGLEGQTAGLTYFNGRLYYYDWVASSGSTLRIYSVSRGATVVKAPAPVPAASTWSVAAAALLLAFVARRRMRARPR
jgi:hypothetical protein